MIEAATTALRQIGQTFTSLRQIGGSMSTLRNPMSEQPTADTVAPAAPTHFAAMFWNAEPLPHPELDILATDKRHASTAAAHRIRQSTLPDDKKAEVIDRIAAWDGTTSHSIQTPEGWVCLMSTEAFAPV